MIETIKEWINQTNTAQKIQQHPILFITLLTLATLVILHNIIIRL